MCPISYIKHLAILALSSIPARIKSSCNLTVLYSVVRHPIYSGALLLFLFSPIALDSFFGMIPAVLNVVILIFRILDEEKYLTKNLSGYSDYCKMTKFRLVPYIW